MHLSSICLTACKQPAYHMHLRQSLHVNAGTYMHAGAHLACQWAHNAWQQLQILSDDHELQATPLRIRIRSHLFQPHQADQMPGCHWTSQLHKRTSCLNMHE